MISGIFLNYGILESLGGQGVLSLGIPCVWGSRRLNVRPTKGPRFRFDVRFFEVCCTGARKKLELKMTWTDCAHPTRGRNLGMRAWHVAYQDP